MPGYWRYRPRGLELDCEAWCGRCLRSSSARAGSWSWVRWRSAAPHLPRPWFKEVIRVWNLNAYDNALAPVACTACLASPLMPPSLGLPFLRPEPLHARGCQRYVGGHGLPGHRGGRAARRDGVLGGLGSVTETSHSPFSLGRTWAPWRRMRSAGEWSL